MSWTLGLAYYLDEAPWPATKEQLLDYANRTGAPLAVVENLEKLEDSDSVYDNMLEVWPDFPMEDSDFLYADDE